MGGGRRGVRGLRRRWARTAALALASAGGAATPAWGQSPWVLRDVAPGVLATVAADSSRYTLFGNSLVVIGREGVLVVDSRDTEEHAQALIDQIRRLTDLPVRYLVNSHWHWDHVNGNQTFRAAYPDVEIVGHPETARLMTREGPARLADEIRRLEERGARLRRYRSQSATDDGRPLTDEDRSRIEEILGADGARIAALESIAILPPHILVDDDWEASGLGKEVHVLAPPPAHTPGDLAVWVPDAGVLFVGDVIEHGIPFVGDGSVTGHAESLHALDSLEARIHLPGHGPVPTDDGLFRGQLGFWIRLNDAIEAPPADSAAWDDVAEALILRTPPTAFPGGWEPDGAVTPGLRSFVQSALGQGAAERAADPG